METLVVNLFLFLRPILSVDLRGFTAGGNYFELLTIVLTIILGLVAIANTFSGKRKNLVSLEVIFCIFIIWCLCVAFMYYNEADFKILVKWILPLFTYLIFRRAFIDRLGYWKSLKWVLIGYSLPVTYSAILMAGGSGLWVVDYWTGLERYSGAYSGPHEMSHSIALFIMTTFIYVNLNRIKKYVPPNKWFYIFLAFLMVLAFYCVFKGYVRTTYVGLGIFFLTWLFFKSKVKFILGIMAMLIVFTVVVDFSTIFGGVSKVASGTGSIEDVGSGRPYIWKRNLELFAMKPFDRQLAGIGIGNFERTPTWNETINPDSKIWNSHNDYLETLFEVGAIGLIIVIMMYFAMYRSVMRIKGQERYLFIALLNAVVVMNFLSNSYISRFAIAQLFYIIIVYAELPDKKEKSESVMAKKAAKSRVLRRAAK